MVGIRPGFVERRERLTLEIAARESSSPGGVCSDGAHRFPRYLVLMKSAIVLDKKSVG